VYSLAPFSLAATTALEHAREGVLPLVTQLNDSDALGILEATEVAPGGLRAIEPLSPLEKKDMAALRAKLIQNLQAKAAKAAQNTSSPSLIPALRHAGELLEGPASKVTERRILVFCDRPMRDADCVAFLNEAKKLAKKRISVSLFAFGVELDTEFIQVVVPFSMRLVTHCLFQALNQTRGANSFFISSGDQLRKLLGAGLEFAILPAAFNFTLRFESGGWELQYIYGSSRADLPTATLWQVKRDSCMCSSCH
jgi:hypothetical protein